MSVSSAFTAPWWSQQNLLVRVLASCETMGNASVVCTDKTGTLTQNVTTLYSMLSVPWKREGKHSFLWRPGQGDCQRSRQRSPERITPGRERERVMRRTRGYEDPRPPSNHSP